MKSISYSAKDIKSWFLTVTAILGGDKLPLICLLCSFNGLFEFLDSKKRKIYDLNDSEYIPGQFKTMSIQSDVITILVMKCPECGEHFYVFPNFIIKGTTLTLRAILFVGMMYESGYGLVKKCTWRFLADQIGSAVAIDHSVLYRAVHALGKTIESHREIQHLMGLYPEIFPPTEEVKEAWPPEKSKKENTKKRELGIRRVLTDVWRGICKDISLFDGLFAKLQEKIAGIFTNFGITLATLYPLAHNA